MKGFILRGQQRVVSAPFRSSRGFSTSLFHPSPVWRSGGFHYRKSHAAPEDTADPLTKPTNIDKGALHVVSVPIGNLKDFSYRAMDILREVDYIVTTDRPATKTLLDLVGVPNQGRLIHYSASNRVATHERLVEMLKGGRSMALVTTSGTPCVGDVGADLVQAMQADGVRVTAVPGASALLSALAVCGVTYSTHEKQFHPQGGAKDSIQALSSLRDGSFYFGNMLPESSTARLQILRTIVAPAQYPCVFYEVPRRLLAVLQDIASLLPQRKVYLTHELTKLNESLHADTAERLMAFYLRQESGALLKLGQVVIVISGASPSEVAEWVEKEMEKRRRLRKDVDTLMSSSAESAGEVVEEKKTVKSKKLKRRKKLAALKRKRRDRLIRQIETEQEKLRLQMSINKNDANRF